MYITIVLFFLVNIYSNSDNSEMEYCDDSPVKKKIRQSAKKANESSRQCIIYVCDGGMLLFFLKEGSLIFFSGDLHFLVSKNNFFTK